MYNQKRKFDDAFSETDEKGSILMYVYYFIFVVNFWNLFDYDLLMNGAKSKRKLTYFCKGVNI